MEALKALDARRMGIVWTEVCVALTVDEMVHNSISFGEKTAWIGTKQTSITKCKQFYKNRPSFPTLVADAKMGEGSHSLSYSNNVGLLMFAAQ